ncbi:UxaA family hydrolase [Succinivibrio dextrinosolvens]|uniref:UxaA family hydrolase n=1 Tax=Succinivibrio dextrinosolvens TaxID=83771 RepID=UPI001922E787|nr:altronate dehydratase family protein [Succinivibrio dextrinosolvens]
MQCVVINPREDVVAVALDDLKAGQTVKTAQGDVTLKDDITRGHKFALYDLNEGDQIIKYGYSIGHATCPIQKGQHVHSQNVKTNLSGTKDYTYNRVEKTELKKVERTFEGYVRADGQVGIRNEVWIIPTVFCVNHIAKELETYAREKLEDFTNVDGCYALTHPYGCSQMGEDQSTTQKLLASLTRHPNAGAILVLGLGCENNNLSVFKKFLDLNDDRLMFLNTQDVEDELEAGYEIIDSLLQKANESKRETVPLSKLRIGLKCGGSDGLSGITANPLIGRVSDLIVGAGGTSVMTEVPEMFGAEQILMNRAKNEDVFKKTVSLINDFKGYFKSHGETVSENPSPGNKAGGITTLEDKSLGCVQKGGKAQVEDTIRYAETIKSSGLNLLNAPGNDGVSCSALAACGVNMILFSTGRGTPFSTVVPTIKISTNNALFEKKGGNWIDFNAGAIVDGKDFDELAMELLDYIIAIASGQKSVSEKRDFHELLIWKDGVTL